MCSNGSAPERSAGQGMGVPHPQSSRSTSRLPMRQLLMRVQSLSWRSPSRVAGWINVTRSENPDAKAGRHDE